MKRCHIVFLAILLIRCKQSPDKQASNQQDSSSSPAVSARKAYDYCYSNSRGVFVFKNGDTAGIPIKLSVTNAKLSPDGTFLAYTDQSSPDQERKIGMMDLTTQKPVILDTACHNCYGPVWSPDEKYLAYNAMEGETWNVKYINIESGKSAFISLHTGKVGNFSPQWTADNKIIVNDMASIYIIGLSGKIFRTIDITTMDSMLFMGSSTQFILAEKENKLIFDSQTADDTTHVNKDDESDEPPPRLFAFDLAIKKLTQLGPQDYSFFSPVLKGDTIFCGGERLKGKVHSNIYSMDLAGAHFKLAFRDAQDFSCRTQK